MKTPQEPLGVAQRINHVLVDQPISLLVSGPQPASPGAGDPRGWRTSEAANGNPGISARSQRGKPYNPVFANWVSFRLLRVRLHPRDPPPPAPRSRGIRPLLAGSAPTHAPFSQGCRRSWKPRQIQRSRTDPVFQKSRLFSHGANDTTPRIFDVAFFLFNIMENSFLCVLKTVLRKCNFDNCWCWSGFMVPRRKS